MNRWFAIERINGDDLCPTYMYRFVLLKLPAGRRVYLHVYVGNDWSRDPHDHPKVFWSIGLWGSYIEDVYRDGKHTGSTSWRAPWIRRFEAVHQHRIRCKKLAVTLCFTGRETRRWGFWMDGVWIPFVEYLQRHAADRTDC